MTATIHKLDRHTIDSIAAGEVIERPASVVKELIDNALDAGAGVIRLTIENGGIRLISCEDDGRGMSHEDALLALESHATSKLMNTDDLFDLKTLGFRGEALPSIAAVSRLELRTRTRDAAEGTRVVVEGGERVFTGPCGIAPGTIVTCRDLFFNTPARYKFLKSDAAEGGAIADLTGKAALTRPDVSFRLDRDNEKKEVLYTPGNNDLLSAIYAVYGADVATAMVPVKSETPPIRVEGFVTTPEASRHNRSRQIFIVNGRVIQSGTLRAAAEEASKTWFMRGRFPQLVLNIEIPRNLVDVNVHPQKLEMRFWDERVVFRAVYQALRGAFEQGARLIQPGIASEKTKDKSEERFQMSIDSLKDDTISLIEDKTTTDTPFHDNTSTSTTHGEAGSQSEGVYHDDKQFSQDIRVIDHEQQPQTSNTSPEFSDLPGDASKEISTQDQNDVASLKRDAEASPIDSLLNARLVGTLFNTYIFLDDGESMILIDQHAAHERILYEELLQRRHERSGLMPSQVLLVPVRVTVSASEMALLTEHEEHFRALGFDYEPFGGQSVVIRSVPAGNKFEEHVRLDPAMAIRAAIDGMETAQSTGNIIDDTEILHLVACKAAVKAHDRLSDDEINILLKRLTTLTNPYHCPHGRPVAIKLTKTEIEKLFGRIV